MFPSNCEIIFPAGLGLPGGLCRVGHACYSSSGSLEGCQNLLNGLLRLFPHQQSDIPNYQSQFPLQRSGPSDHLRVLSQRQQLVSLNWTLVHIPPWCSSLSRWVHSNHTCVCPNTTGLGRLIKVVSVCISSMVWSQWESDSSLNRPNCRKWIKHAMCFGLVLYLTPILHPSCIREI